MLNYIRVVDPSQFMTARSIPSAVQNIRRASVKRYDWQKCAIYADKALLVINKPAGVVSQPNDTESRRSVSFL